MNIGTSDFRTIELSPCAAEFDGLQFATVKSKALRARADLTLYIPSGCRLRQSVPVVILLHGVYGSHWAWALKGRAHASLREMVACGSVPDMILAMPSDGLWGDGSGYLKHPAQDFEAWIAREVPALVSAITGNAASAPHFIAGLSMGGYGALRIGAKYPDIFRAFCGHSSITQFSEMSTFVEEPAESYACPTEDHSVLETLLRHRATLRPFRFDCGIHDPLIHSNRTLHSQLTGHGIPHHFEEYPGGHEWEYWSQHVRDSFLFFGQTMLQA